MGPSWLLAAALGSGLSTEFRLDTESPDALCPEIGMTRAAVAQRLGELDVENGAGWHGTYTIVHDPHGRRGDYIRLTVLEGDQVQLVRDLPTASESCANLATAIAIVVEGFFRDIAQERLRDAPTPNDFASAQPSEAQISKPYASNQVPAQVKDESLRLSAPTAAPRPILPTPAAVQTRRALGAMAGVSYESAQVDLGFDVGLFGAIDSLFRWELRLGVPFGTKIEHFGPGEARLRAYPIRLAVPYRMGSDRASFFVGPSILLSVERASSRGLVSETPQTRIASGLGARAGAAFWPSRWFGLSVSTGLDAMVLPAAAFTIDGEKVFELPRIRASLQLDLMTVVFP